MIDEKRLIEEIEKLPFIHGRYDKKNANPHFINGVESMYEMIINLIKSQSNEVNVIDTAKVNAMQLLKKLVDRREELQELVYTLQEREAYIWCDICEAKREEVVDIINMVTEMAEPQTIGKWIIERDPAGNAVCFHCSECDYDFEYIGIKTAYPYCPRCGSKMDNSQAFERGEA